MTLDNGAADGEANPHTVALGRVERLEKSVRILRLKTHTGILHGQAHTIAFLSFRFDHQLPRPILDAAHGVYGVQEQVQDHLLELDAISHDRREIAG
jgi:hypothetical protein